MTADKLQIKESSFTCSYFATYRRIVPGPSDQSSLCETTALTPHLGDHVKKYSTQHLNSRSICYF